MHLDMKLNILRRRMALLVVVLLSIAGLAFVFGSSASPPSQNDNELASADRKIAPEVVQDTANGEPASVIVFLADQADVSAANDMKDQDARGWYVYKTLSEHAERTQAPLKEIFDAEGVNYQSFWVANMLVVDADRALVDQLATRSDVGRIDSNRPAYWIEDPVIANRHDSTTKDTPYTTEWGVNNVNAPAVWAMGFTGQGIVVGDLDTGTRWTHVALKPKYRGWNGTVADHNYNWHDAIHVANTSCTANTQAPCDDQGHGTHTAGSMVGDDGVGNQVGVAPGARWIGCRNMNAGVGSPATYTECFQWTIAPTDLAGNNPDPTRRPHILNNSWGCPTSEGCTTRAELETIVNNTQAAGIFVEASAGNSGSSGCSSVSDPPALYSATFSTGAISQSNTLASFSSRGPSTFYTPNLLKPNVSAPGVNVRSSYGSGDTVYQNLDGTSMAGPHTCGVVALLWSARPALVRDIAATKTILQNSANPAVTVNPVQTCGGTPSSQIPNNSFGYGRVDALAAVNLAGGASTPTPTPTPATTPTPTPPVPTPTPTRTPTPTPPNPTPTPTRTPTPTPATTPTPTPPSPSPTPSPNCVPGAQLIADGTFDTEPTPWPLWTIQTSTNFGTPLCDATCGTGGNTAGPFSGANWAWFGGAPVQELATLGQTYTVPSTGPATLTFQMWVAAPSGPLTDRLEVRVDGTLLQTFMEPPVAEPGYSLRTIPLNFATTGSHTILFSYFGPGEGGANFNVDNIALNMGAPCSLHSRADFDGDNKTDLSVFRPSEGNWYLQRSTAGFIGLNWGLSSDRLVPADYDNDGKADVAVFRADANEANPDFYVLNSSNGTVRGVSWGIPGDIPVVGDYDGDGAADVAVYRPSNNSWYIVRSTAGFISAQFGSAGDVPLVMDADGDGAANIGVFRSSGNTWYIATTLVDPSHNFTATQWGQAGDLLVPADYDGDNKDDVAVFRPSDGVWYIRKSSNSTLLAVQFGANGDIPVPGDYDGDGKDDEAVFRNGAWYLNRSTAGFAGGPFGVGSDLPVPKAYIP